MKKLFYSLVLLSFLSGCQTYRFAHNLKLVSVSDDLSEGKSLGNVRGKDCQSFVFGIPTGPAVTLEKALEDAQNQKKSNVRYFTDVATDTEGFDAFFFRKHCIVVKAKGYR